MTLHTLGRPIYIFGAGPQGRITAEVAERVHPHARIVFLDDNLTGLPNATVDGHPVIYSDEPNASDRELAFLYVALGHPYKRELVTKRLTDGGGYKLGPALIDPTAYVSKHTKIGRGSVVCHQALVENGAHVGENVIVNTASYVGHDSDADDYACICPYARIGGRSQVRAHGFIGYGAQVMTRLVIGDGAIVGARSLVRNDVSAGMLVYGIPAKPHGAVGPDFDWKKVL